MNNNMTNKSQPSHQQKLPPIPIPLPNPTNIFTNNNNKMHNRKASLDIKKVVNNNINNNNNNKGIWDCGSSLYDSVELDSFRKQLDSAIINSSRTLSMPRLPSEHHRAPPQPTKKPSTSSSKFSRTFQKLLKSVFRASKHEKSSNNINDNKSGSGSGSPDPWFFDSPDSFDGKTIDGGKYYVVYDNKPGMSGLSAIPEVNEVNNSLGIQASSLIRKTMSERFTAVSRGIYCK